jgi:phosphoribosylformylglycinamidine synthase
MGAAGLTSSSCEMAAKGDVGMSLNLDLVPAREPDMKPYEYLLSESQERMLFVLEKGKEQPVLDVFAKWRIPAVVIGEVTADENIRFYHQGQLVVDVPAKLLTDLAPSYDPGKEPSEPETAKARRMVQAESAFADIQKTEIEPWLTKILNSSNVANPTGIFSQYDRHVQNNTALSSENLGAGVVRLRKEDGSHSGKALATTVDCNARYVYLDPYQGTLAAVAQAARNLVCTGAQPLAVSDNLNFGNPEKPDIYYQLYSAVRGIKDACLAFDTPVISGNVSLYNEHSGTAIYPTPTIAMVGLIEDERLMATPSLPEAGLKLALMGRFLPSLGGSEYQKLKTGKTEGPPPDVDLKAEQHAMQAVLSMVQSQKVRAVQDVSLGGLLTTLTEMTFAQEIGVSLSLEALKSAVTKPLRTDELLFGETAGTYLVAYRPEEEPSLKALCQGAAFVPFGETVDSFNLKIDDTLIDLKPAKECWSTRLARL